MSKLVITGRGPALERFAREQRLRFKKEGFTAAVIYGNAPVADVKTAPVADVKDVPVADVKDAPVEDVKDVEPEADTKEASVADVKGKKSKK